jgi:hypothetical protein
MESECSQVNGDMATYVGNQASKPNNVNHLPLLAPRLLEYYTLQSGPNPLALIIDDVIAL